MEEIQFKGKIFEVVAITQPDGKVFEVARRAPGVRVIIADKVAKKILLTKEFRQELNAWDYRLPGGKVFDTLDEFEKFRVSAGDMVHSAGEKAKQEASEEASINVAEVCLYEKSVLGTTVEWDLYVYEATDWQLRPEGQNLEQGEQIDAVEWFTYAQAEDMIFDGKIQEHRIALILLKWIKSQK